MVNAYHYALPNISGVGFHFKVTLSHDSVFDIVSQRYSMELESR